MLLLLLHIFSFIFQAPDKLNENLDRYLVKELPGYEKIEFKVEKMPADFKKIDIQEDSRFNLNGSTAYVPVKVTYKDNHVTQTFLTLNVKLYKSVFVAKDRIDRKKFLGESDFDIRLVDVAGIRGKLVSLDEKINNFRSKTFIRKDDVLTDDLIERIPAILAGDRVKAYFVNGNVSIDFFVNARQDGVEGDVIRVVTPDNRQFKAKIIDSKNVIINE